MRTVHLGDSLISWHLPADVACPKMKMLETLRSQKVCKKPSDDVHLRRHERTQEKELEGRPYFC